MTKRWSGLLADTRPLANRRFRRLFIATIVTVIGAQFLVVVGTLIAVLAVPAFVRYRVIVRGET